MSLLNQLLHKVSTRRQIKIKEVRDGILILPNNEYRSILETSSVNFELKSEAEQEVLIDNFQNFLNSLPQKLQIIIRVRELDIDRYVDRITQSRFTEKDSTYKEQLESYGNFMKVLVSGNKILSRRFFIVIPYKPEDKAHDFQIIKEQLNLNRDLVLRGIEKLSMRAKQLDSLELLDLFYTFYNPRESKVMELKGHTIEMLLKNQYA